MKKRNGKRIGVFLLVMLMLFTLGGSTVVADDTDSSTPDKQDALKAGGDALRDGETAILDNNGVYYATLATAFNSLQAGESRTFTILGDARCGRNDADAAYIRADCDVTILAGIPEASITGMIPKYGTGKLTLGNNDKTNKLKINGMVSVYNGSFEANAELTINGGSYRAIWSAPSSAVYSTSISINGGTYTSDDSQTCYFSGTNVAIDHIDNATIINPSGSDGALVITYGAKAQRISNSTITGYRYGIYIRSGSSIELIDKCTISGYGIGITALLSDSADQVTRIGTISNSSIESRAVIDGFSTYADAVIIERPSSGQVRIDKITNCTLTCNSTYQYSGAIRVCQREETPEESWGKVSCGEISDCTMIMPNGASGIVVQAAVVGDLKNNKTTASAGYGSGIRTFKGRVGNITGGEYTVEGTSTGAAFSNSSSAIGDISSATFTGGTDGITNISSMIGDITNVVMTGSRTGLYTYSGSTVGDISGCTITHTGSSSNGGILNNSSEIGDITNSKVTSGYIGIYNSNGTAGNIRNCTISGQYGIANIKSSASYDGSILSVDGNTISATKVGIQNQGGNIPTVSDNTINADQGIVNLSSIGTISGGLITSERHGIVVQKNAGNPLYVGTTDTIDGVTINAGSEGIKAHNGSTITTLSGNNIQAATDAVLIVPGATIGQVASGLYKGEGNGVACQGTLKTVTGDPVFWGKGGYAIDNSEAEAETAIEPDLTDELQGYARYLGDAGQIADEEKCSFPVHIPKTIAYRMSTVTEPVEKAESARMHYLTVPVRLTYDANGGKGDMSDKGYDGDFTTEYPAEENAFFNDGFDFAEWNTDPDGEGDAYAPNDPVSFDQSEIVLYAQWKGRTRNYAVEYYYQVNGTYPAEPDNKDTRSGEYGTQVSVTDEDKEPEKEGYVLDGAKSDAYTGTIAEDGTLALKVYFKQQFTITFDPNGGTLNGSTSPVRQNHDHGDEITIIEAPSRDGYDFLYWKGSEYQPGEKYRVEGDHTFTAVWKEEGSSDPDPSSDPEPDPSSDPDPSSGSDPSSSSSSSSSKTDPKSKPTTRPSNSGGPSQTRSPKTDDGSMPGMWIALMTICAAVLVLHIHRRRKARN